MAGKGDRRRISFLGFPRQEMQGRRRRRDSAMRGYRTDRHDEVRDQNYEPTDM